MSVSAAARIGPNAIIRTAQALRETGGEARAREVFARAGLVPYLDAPPESMVDEREVATLHVALRETCPQEADALAARAGRLTAEYLLAHRIPRPAQWLLRALPPAPAARLLLRAIGGHAWTFAGSGTFTAQVGRARERGATLRIAGCPLCRRYAQAHQAHGSPLRAALLSSGPESLPERAHAPVCGFYAATFEHLFRTLVAADTRVTESACEALGEPACTFDVRW